MDIEKVEKMADGSTILGKAAKENGLIDKIGGIEESKGWLKKNFKIEPNLCIVY